jgi:glycerate 2-kinase
MARALGFRFFADAKELKDSINQVEKLTRIELPSPAALRLPLPEGEEKGEGTAQIIAAVDVKNPLLGENGATRVFGPQKAVSPDQIPRFEAALAKLADVVAEQFGFDYRNEAGAGAAGGLGFGLMSFCGAKIRPGFDVVAKAVGLESKMKNVDLVITGEGSLDRQTLEGKTPAGVARIARKLGKAIFAFVGRATDDRQVRELFDGVYQNARPKMSTEENMKRAAELLRDNARQLAEDLKRRTYQKRQRPNAH